jgi:hypothetical protein
MVCVLMSGCAQMRRLPTAVRSEVPALAPVALGKAGAEESGQGSYPLAIGNHWLYSWSLVQRRIVAGRETLTTRAFWTSEQYISGRTTLDGQDFFRLETTQDRDGVVGLGVTFLRQDRRGLYERDVPAPGQIPTEHPVLEYPLHTGASWRLWPGTSVQVEGREVVDIPKGRSPAWRLRMVSDDVGEGVIDRMWFSDCGYVGLLSTSHHEYVDPDAGLVVFDAEVRQWLTTVTLVKDGPQVLGVAKTSFSQSLQSPAQSSHPSDGSENGKKPESR